MAEFKRIFALAANAVFCAFAAGFVALYMQGKFLSPSDGAYGMSVSETLADPFVLMVWWPFVAIGACIGFVFSAVLLWKTKLTRTIPTVAVVTIAVVAVVATGLAPLAPFAGLFAGVGTMMWCRRRPGWQVEPPT